MAITLQRVIRYPIHFMQCMQGTWPILCPRTLYRTSLLTNMTGDWRLWPISYGMKGKELESSVGLIDEKNNAREYYIRLVTRLGLYVC